MSYVLAIDFGTSGCRSAVYNARLEMLSSAIEEYPLILHSETEIEQDADLWWEKAKKTIRAAVAASGVPTSEICALSISSQGIAFVPIDRSGKTLFHAISWLDTRAEAETEALAARYGMQALYTRTGKRLSGVYTLPKLIWFRNHHPDVYEAAWKILLPLDFIQFRLSGRCVTDHTIAGGTMFYDVSEQAWDQALLQENGLDVQKLPEIAWAGTPVGTILPEVADELGLSRETLIVNGAQDQKCAAYGAGAAEDVAAISLGTGSCLAQISSAPAADPSMRVPFFSYVRDGQWDLEGVINTAGSAYSWFRQNFAPQLSFQQLNDAAAAVPAPNPVLFFPYLSGVSSPNWGNGTGTFTGLSLSSTAGHMARAVMEGIAFNIRENLEAMQAVCGPARELRLYGGGSKSDLWCQIIADVANIPVARLVSSETALAGASMLAYHPLGVQTPASLSCAQRFAPDAQQAAAYQAAYEHYESIRQKYFSE